MTSPTAAPTQHTAGPDAGPAEMHQSLEVFAKNISLFWDGMKSFLSRDGLKKWKFGSTPLPNQALLSASPVAQTGRLFSLTVCLLVSYLPC